MSHLFSPHFTYFQQYCLNGKVSFQLLIQGFLKTKSKKYLGNSDWGILLFYLTERPKGNTLYNKVHHSQFPSFKWFVKKWNIGAGKVAHQLGKLAALPEELGYSPAVTWWLTAWVTPLPEYIMPSSDLQEHPADMWCIHMYKCKTYIYKINNYNSKNWKISEITQNLYFLLNFLKRDQNLCAN